MPNPNISQLITTTLESQVPKIIDNVTNNHPLLMKMKEKGNIKKLSGGNVIRESLSYASNTTVQSQGEYDTFDTTPQDVLTSADFDFKIITGTTTMTDLEMKQNAGKERIIDLFKGKFSVLETSLKNEIGSQIYGDGTGNGSKDIGGLQLLIADDPTTGTVGGINRANYSFWRNQLWDFSVESVTASATTIQNAMNTLYLRCQVQAGELPDLIAADSIYFTYYEDSLQTIQRITDSKIGALGFATLKYKNADVFYDPECPSSHMYFINSNHVYLKYLGKDLLEAGETTRPVNQNVFVTPLVFTGNMTLTNARVQGVMIA
jgi:hypothetical protein